MKQITRENFIKENKTLSNSARLLARTIAMLYTRAGKIMDSFLSNFGITTAQYNVLVLLAEEKCPVNQLTISKRMLVSQGNITRILDKLVRAALITRAEDKQDRRHKCIALTAKGKTLYKKIKPEYNKFIQRLSKPISEKEQKYISAVFVKWMYFLRDFSL